MVLVIVGVVNLFIYFVDGRIGDLEQPNIIFFVDRDAS